MYEAHPLYQYKVCTGYILCTQVLDLYQYKLNLAYKVHILAQNVRFGRLKHNHTTLNHIKACSTVAGCLDTISNIKFHRRSLGRHVATAKVTVFWPVDKRILAQNVRFGRPKHNQTTPKRAALLAGCWDTINNKKIYRKGTHCNSQSNDFLAC